MSFHLLSSSEISQGIANGNFTASEVLDDYLSRIKATNGKVNAFTAQHYERAQQQAQSIDRSDQLYLGRPCA